VQVLRGGSAGGPAQYREDLQIGFYTAWRLNHGGRIDSMGRGMVKNLVVKGNLSKPVIIQNRTRARSDKLAEALGSGKVTPVDTVEEAVRQSDIIFTCLGEGVLSCIVELASMQLTVINRRRCRYRRDNKSRHRR
jgi:hypothetical protein